MIEQFLERGVWMKNNDMIVPNGQVGTHKEQFFNVARRRAQILDVNTYAHLTGSKDTLADFKGGVLHIHGGRVIENVGLFVNVDQFLLRNGDFRDTIPVTIHNKIYEFWLHINDIDVGNLAGKILMREKFNYAFKKGKADRYLQFIWKLSRQGHPEFPKNIFEENLRVYQDTRKNFTQLLNSLEKTLPVEPHYMLK